MTILQKSIILHPYYIKYVGCKNFLTKNWGNLKVKLTQFKFSL